MGDEPKILWDALRILIEAHTRDDDRAGFTVHHCTIDPFYQGAPEYVSAWRIVREQMRCQTEPVEPL